MLDYLRFMVKSPSAPSERTVRIEMRRVSPDRRLFQLCRLFTENGYQCAVQLNARTFARMDKYGRMILQDENVVRASAKRRTRCGVVIADTPPGTISPETVHLSYDVFNPDINDQRAMFYPILMHPRFLNRGTEQLSLSAARRHDIAALFAGNVDSSHYNNPRTRQHFNVDTRWELFSHVAATLSSEHRYQPDTYAEFCDQLESGRLRNKVVLLNTDVVRIPPSDWLPILSRTDFFIHMPGYIQPFCHNQIESMAAGAVPITQFPHLFRPALVHQVNALVYQTRDQLTETLLAIVRGAIPGQDIERMRSAISNYYRQQLSFDSFGSRLNECLGSSGASPVTLYICSGETSMTGEAHA